MKKMASLSQTEILKYECGYCNKSYKKQTLYHKHVILCEILRKSIIERKNENEKIDNTPSIPELFDIIKSLVIRHDQLEKKIEKMSTWVNSAKKKLNVIEWLNEHKKLSQPFKEWLIALKLTKEDMELVFNYNFAEGMRFIIQKYFQQMDDLLPIKAFEQKDNTFYVFTETGWEIMKPEQFEFLFNTLTKGLINQLKLWQDENRHRICSNGFTEIYVANVKKITGGDLSKEQQYLKVKRALYTNLKINIRNVIQYDFEF
jgi:hypothetical protein